MAQFILLDKQIVNISEIVSVYPVNGGAGGCHLRFKNTVIIWSRLSVQQIWEKLNEQTPNRSSN